MSVRVMTKVWELDLPSTEKMVLLNYADHSSDNGNQIWPSKHTVAKSCSLTERTVFKLTKKLVQEGYLVKVGKTRYHTILYRINLSKLHESDMKEKQDDQKCQSDMNLDASISDRDSVKPSLTINKSSSSKRFHAKINNQSKYIPQIDPKILSEFKKKERN